MNIDITKLVAAGRWVGGNVGKPFYPGPIHVVLEFATELDAYEFSRSTGLQTGRPPDDSCYAPMDPRERTSGWRLFVVTIGLVILPSTSLRPTAPPDNWSVVVKTNPSQPDTRRPFFYTVDNALTLEERWVWKRAHQPPSPKWPERLEAK